MGLHRVCWGLLPNISAVQHPEIEVGSAAGQSQRAYFGLLVVFGSTDSCAAKGTLNRAVRVMELVRVLWPSRCNGLTRRNKTNRSIAVSHELGVAGV